MLMQIIGQHLKISSIAMKLFCTHFLKRAHDILNPILYMSKSHMGIILICGPMVTKAYLFTTLLWSPMAPNSVKLLELAKHRGHRLINAVKPCFTAILLYYTEVF